MAKYGESFNITLYKVNIKKQLKKNTPEKHRFIENSINKSSLYL